MTLFIYYQSLNPYTQENILQGTPIHQIGLSKALPYQPWNTNNLNSIHPLPHDADMHGSSYPLYQEYSGLSDALYPSSPFYHTIMIKDTLKTQVEYRF